VRALDLAWHGIPVFPAAKDDKRPLTKHGFKDATTDERTIRRWRSHCPDALVSVPTGHRFVVLDVDRKHPGALEWFARECGELAGSRKHYTRSGGFHVLLRPHPEFTCTAGKIELGIDTRGAGGYIIWWPAHGYTVENPDTLLPVPDWLLQRLHPPAPPPAQRNARYNVGRDREIGGLIRAIVFAREGERNAVTFWASCRFAELVREGRLGRDEAIDIIIESASRAGLDRKEAQSTARSAFRTTGIWL
jgi:hypothetical protein